MTLTRRDKDKIKDLIREELTEQMADSGHEHGRSFETDADELAAQVASGLDIMYGSDKGLSYRETIRERHGVDPADYDNEPELREALAEKRQGSV